LKLQNNHWEPNKTVTLISSIGSSLTNLVYQAITIDHPLNEEVYKAIITYCMNLDKFETWTDNLRIFNYLKNIKCHFTESHRVIRRLASNLPNDLKVFTLQIYAETIPTYLESFFLNFDHDVLLEELNFDLFVTDGCLEIILKYIGKMKSLKKLRIIEKNYEVFDICLKNCWNKKLWKKLWLLVLKLKLWQVWRK